MKRQISKRWVISILIILLLIAAIHLLSAITLDRQIEYVEIEYASPKISNQLDGYRIAFVTDVHNASSSRLEKIVERINSHSPNLLLLGGDFALSDKLKRDLSILSAIQAPDGIYGVEGNHDDCDMLKEAMEAEGMVLLENEGVSIVPGLYLGGLMDLWNREPNVESALAGAGENDCVILLAHNPDTSMYYNTSQADLMLSGHTHGGQVNLFGLWAPALVHPRLGVTGFGQRFRSGWAEGHYGTDIYVSNGIGAHYLDLRVFARPQVVYLTLRSQPSQEQLEGI